MIAVVHHEGFPSSGNFFNQFPFEFGGYKTLAHSKKGLSYFSVGFETDQRMPFFFRSNEKKKDAMPSGLIAAFRENDGLPVLCHLFAWLGEYALAFYEEEFKSLDRVDQAGLSKNLKISNVVVEDPSPQGLPTDQLLRLLYSRPEKERGGEGKNRQGSEEMDFLLRMLSIGGMSRWGGRAAMAFAPMRSRPKRTYDQLSDEFSPEGDHVPLLLARATDPNNKQAKALHEALRDFGRYSEMFTDIGVKQLGRGSGDPFQVQVKIGAKNSNIMDVGYGVSQILPLIVDAQRASATTTLLLQQPEVHLHPKAQAALGSMIKDWVLKSKKTVVVETHSDYLVDRLRLEIKRKNLAPGDVKIFFLEKKGNQTQLHALEIDAEGNVLNAPDGHRDFFLLEQMALLVD